MSDGLFSREVRLGIVMYGGVSLAVYENGVAQELFRAVKGEGVYRLIKELTDSDIVVDIMSGTSAGGINGIMLGHALANDRDFTASASLWRNDGDILKLLRQTSDPETLSVLDSRGYYQSRLEAAYDRMPPYPAEKRAAARPSEMEELDVFVTSTDVHGKIHTEFDEEGHPIDVKDHRQVFLLSYRKDRKNEFDPKNTGTVPALAKLSRMTSCFPVAFEPVRLPDPRDNKDADALLRRWGSLPPEHAAYYLDGGLLDNKPFSYTIHQIVRRTARRPVNRMLLYVEPDPEKFVDTLPTDAPNVMQSALDALVNIPGYQSIASDLQNIAEQNDRSRTSEQILDAAMPWIDKEFAPAKASPGGAQATGAGNLSMIKDPGRQEQYLQCRLSQIMQRGLEGILKRNGQKLKLEKPEERHAASVLVESFTELMNPKKSKDAGPKQTDEEVKKAERERRGLAEDVLTNFDVYYRLRRMFAVSDCALSEEGIHETTIRSGFMEKINDRIKYLEMVQFAMEKVADDAPIDWLDLKLATANPEAAGKKWKQLQSALLELLDSRMLGEEIKKLETSSSLITAKKQRQFFMQALNKRIEAASSLKHQGNVKNNLLLEFDAVEAMLLNPCNNDGLRSRAWDVYRKFSITDSYRFPLEYMSGMETTETIHTVRISPIDAKRAFSNRSLDEKICGNELAHFGGFLKSSWRANDIMWGRLDGVCELIECLVTKDRIREVSTKSQWPSYDRAALKKYFPTGVDAELGNLEKLIKALPAAAADANPDSLEEFWTLLTRMAQREILKEEVPKVLQSAIQQQRDWNEYNFERKPKKDEAATAPISVTPLVWKTGVKEMDAAVLSYAANQMVNESEPPEGWDGYFDTYYRVGEEDLESGIPKPLALEIASHAALRLRESLVAIAGKREQAIRSAGAYKWGVKFPIDAIYSFFRAQRTWPEWSGRLTFGLVLAGLSVLIVETALFWKANLFKEHWPWVAGPAAFLIVLLMFITWVSMPQVAGSPDRNRKFFVHAEEEAWSDVVTRLNFNDGLEILRKVIHAIEASGFEPNVSGLFKSDLQKVLAGTEAIWVKVPRVKDNHDAAMLDSWHWIHSVNCEGTPFRLVVEQRQ